MKAKLGSKKVRPWKWMPFTNPARKDGAMFFHWRRAAEEGKDYPFARFNKVSCHHLDISQGCSATLSYSWELSASWSWLQSQSLYQPWLSLQSTWQIPAG